MSRIPFSKTRIYLTLYALILFLVLVVYSMLTKQWHAYGYIVQDKNQHLVFLAESGTEDGCNRRGIKKISLGVRMSRFEEANAYFCGKYCIEIPLVELKTSNLFCMIKREASQFP